MIDLDLFLIRQGTLPWQPILCKNGAKLPTPCTYRCQSKTEWDIDTSMSANDACILCENFVKFSPVTPQLTGLICERLV